MSARRILIVDDNRALAENMAEVIELRGLEADFFARPGEVLERFAAGRYAAALLDIRMPEIDGIELYRALRERDPGLPAIATTAYARDERLRDALDAGMLAVFPKPVEIPRLLARLACAVHGPRVLVVEDDVALARNLCELLGDRGFSARAVQGCAGARRVLAAGPVAAALVDCRLSDGDGIALVEELLAGGGLPVFVLTGFARELPDARERAEKAGARFFEKPLPIERLLAALPAAPPSAAARDRDGGSPADPIG